MVNKKIIIQEVPDSIISQAQHILQSKTYSSAFRRDIIRQLVGVCAICDGLPTKYVTVNQAGAKVISRYCDKDFEKYQRNENRIKKRKVKK